MTDKAADTLSEHEAMCMEESWQMLAPLTLAAFPCTSSRLQRAKNEVKLEPIPRSFTRDIVEQDEEETSKERLETQQGLENDQEEQQAVIIALAKQQQKLKRERYQALGAQAKKQRISDRRLMQSQRSRQRKVKLQLELEAIERKQLQVMEMRKKRLEWEKQHELPPEKIAQRNADIQRFIQKELDTQARLAREQKQRELEQQRWRHDEVVKQDEVHQHSETLGAAERNTRVQTMDESTGLVPAEAMMGEFEYELVL